MLLENWAGRSCFQRDGVNALIVDGQAVKKDNFVRRAGQRIVLADLRANPSSKQSFRESLGSFACWDWVPRQNPQTRRWKNHEIYPRIPKWKDTVRVRLEKQRPWHQAIFRSTERFENDLGSARVWTSRHSLNDSPWNKRQSFQSLSRPRRKSRTIEANSRSASQDSTGCDQAFLH